MVVAACLYAFTELGALAFPASFLRVVPLL